MNSFEKFKRSAKEFANLKSVVTIAMLLALRTVLAVLVSVRVGESLKISTAFLATAIMGVSFGPTVGLVFGMLGDIIQWAINPTGGLIFGLTLNCGLTGLTYGLLFYKKLPKPVEKKESKLPKWATYAGIAISGVLLTVGSAVLLMAYNDRKKTTYPTWLTTGAIVFCIIAVIILVVLLLTASVDRLYVLRVVAAVVITNVGVNAFLGTYFLAQVYAWDYWVYFVPRLIKNLLLVPINSVFIYYLMLAISKNGFLRNTVLNVNEKADENAD